MRRLMQVLHDLRNLARDYRYQEWRDSAQSFQALVDLRAVVFGLAGAARDVRSGAQREQVDDPYWYETVEGIEQCLRDLGNWIDSRGEHDRPSGF